MKGLRQQADAPHLLHVPWADGFFFFLASFSVSLSPYVLWCPLAHLTSSADVPWEDGFFSLHWSSQSPSHPTCCVALSGPWALLTSSADVPWADGFFFLASSVFLSAMT